MAQTTTAADQCRSELMTAFAAWDWSSAYPVGYAGTTAPLLVPGFPPDIIPNLVTFIRDQQTGAIISFELVNAQSVFRTLGGVYQTLPAGKLRYGQRLEVSLAVTCWADQQAGGADLVARLHSQATGCIFYNQTRLTSYRALRTHSSHEVFEDRPQLWRAELVVEGCGIQSYDL